VGVPGYHRGALECIQREESGSGRGALSELIWRPIKLPVELLFRGANSSRLGDACAEVRTSAGGTCNECRFPSSMGCTLNTQVPGFAFEEQVSGFQGAADPLDKTEGATAG
jgi:hypothetical protein